MAVIPEGSYLMGSSESETDRTKIGFKCDTCVAFAASRRGVVLSVRSLDFVSPGYALKHDDQPAHDGAEIVRRSYRHFDILAQALDHFHVYNVIDQGKETDDEKRGIWTRIGAAWPLNRPAR